jgi:hypothetical protein
VILLWSQRRPIVFLLHNLDFSRFLAWGQSGGTNCWGTSFCSGAYPISIDCPIHWVCQSIKLASIYSEQPCTPCLLRTAHRDTGNCVGRLVPAGSRILSLSAITVVTGNVNPMAHYHYVKAHRGSGGKVTHFLNIRITYRWRPVVRFTLSFVPLIFIYYKAQWPSSLVVSWGERKW